MNGNEIDLRPDAPAAGEVLRVSGQADKSELRAALREAGVFRRVRLSGVAGALAVALLGVALSTGDGMVDFPFVAGAVAYGVTVWLLAPRRIVSRALKTARAHGEREYTLDEGGITVSCAGGEQGRVSWEELKRFHETPEVYVVVGRSGWKTCFFVLPKRLMPAPGQDELVGALLDSRLRRR
ncbi:YcxB family protein [Streptomyces racemochromogenes]|uniref:YcxB family protein n=1 Tax=Streptomyces racemochromogenes TaxID=67353 RepID=A0ABW7P8A5_9ACTN